MRFQLRVEAARATQAEISRSNDFGFIVPRVVIRPFFYSAGSGSQVGRLNLISVKSAEDGMETDPEPPQARIVPKKVTL
jgi:hypothetical protein